MSYFHERFVSCEVHPREPLISLDCTLSIWRYREHQKMLMGVDSLHLCLFPERNEPSARDTHPDTAWSLPDTKPPSSSLPGAFPSLHEAR